MNISGPDANAWGPGGRARTPQDALGRRRFICQTDADDKARLRRPQSVLRKCVMKNLMTPNMTLAIVLMAAMAAVALRAAARRLEPRWAPGAESAPISVTISAPPGQAANAVERMQDIFHELHADGRNAACTVCDSQYRLA